MKTVLTALALAAGVMLAGCSTDTEAGESKSGGNSKTELTGEYRIRIEADASGRSKAEPTVEQRAAEEARAAKAAEDAKDDAEQAKYSTTSEAPLYVTKPMAWFARTDERMRFTRQKLLEAQARISMIHGKYDRQLKSGGDKAKGYVELLEKAEQARIEGQTKGWPVAFDQWVIDNEDALNDKIAEINERMAKNRVLTVEDTAMYNAAKKGLKQSRETLVRFDDAYARFQRTWDKVKLGELGGIPVDLEKEVNEALDITEIFINEWNKVK